MAPPRRIPTKAELLRLQRQFKTDARIAERLGNVEPHLVGYWRRKRSVPNYSAPKFSEKDISILWERFGNDDRCGAELGVSKAAYYSWRRRYGIKSKPAFLKLEQMEIQFPGSNDARSISTNQGTNPALHKLILNKKSESASSKSGGNSSVPDMVVIDNPNAEAIAAYIEEDKRPALAGDRVAILLNGLLSGSMNGAHSKSHNSKNIDSRSIDSKSIDSKSIASKSIASKKFNSKKLNGATDDLALYEWIEKKQIRLAYSAVQGNLWDKICNSGSALPGQLLLCQRGFERFAGAIGALGWSCTDVEIVNALETGKLKIELPNVARVNVTGKRYAPISATDIVISLASNLLNKDFSETAIEYGGSALSSMPIADRQALCAIGSLIDVRAALTPCDTVTLRHFSNLGNWTFSQISPDRDAEFADSYQFNIESVKPMVAIKHAQFGSGSISSQSQLSLDASESNPASKSDPEPDTESNPEPIESQVSFHEAGDVSNLGIDVVFLGGTPGGHYESLRKAAEALHGKKVATGVSLLISPLSQEVYLQALKRGVLRQLIESGAIILNPGVDSPALCSFGISPTAKIVSASIEPLFSSNEYSVDRYVASPLTAAISAVHGHLLDPRGN